MLFDDGLDTVELIMGIEDAFGLSIPDRDGEKIHTAGELCDYIVMRIGARPESVQDRCISARAFYQARQRLVDTFRIERRAIRSDTSVALLLPSTRRRSAWRELHRSLGVRLPRLEFPRWWAVLPFCVLFAGLLAGALFRSATPVLWGAAVVIPSAIFLGMAEIFFGFRVPARYKCVADFSTLLMPMAMKELTPDTTEWTEQDVWQIVRHLTAHCAGVAPSRITKVTDLLRDLI